MRRNVVHHTGLFPPSFGPALTRCGRRVPIESTGHVEHKPGTYRRCLTCQRVMDRKKRLGLWPWSKLSARISEGMKLAWKRKKANQPVHGG